jgi:dolichol-phosphate mannosyltransferase
MHPLNPMALLKQQSVHLPVLNSILVIFVDDDSRDGSDELVISLATTYPNARIITRTTERGLSSAVLAGFSAADPTSTALVCMDADLQHPPEKVVELIQMIKSCDFVIGTRYAASDSIDEDWPMYRRVISAGARALARPLSPLSDPMTGFFAISRRAYAKGGPYSPLGFKICLEMFVKVSRRCSFVNAIGEY